MFAVSCRRVLARAVSGSSAPGRALYSERAQLKRVLRKQKRVTPSSTGYDTEEPIMYPREGHGLNYALNWAVNAYSVTPTNLCFHNLTRRELMARAQGRATATKALVVAGESYEVALVGKDMSLDAYRALSMRMRREHLTDAAELFVQDHAVGARNIAADMRLITNDAATALYASHMFSRSPNSTVDDFEHTFTAFMAPDMVLEDPAAYGLSSGRALLVNVERGTVVGVGVPPTALGEAIGAVASMRLVTPYLDSCFAKEKVENSNKAAKEAAEAAGTEIPRPEQVPKIEPINGVPLPLDAIQYDGKTVLVGGMKTNSANLAYLASAHVNVWADEGAIPLFTGNTLTNVSLDVSQRADVIVQQASGDSVTTSNPSSFGVFESPKSIVVLVDDADLPATVEFSDTTQAVKTILSGYRGKANFEGISSILPKAPWGPLAMRLEELISKNNTSVFVINTNGLKDSAFEKHMLDIFNGSFSAGKSDGFWNKAGDKIDGFLKKEGDKVTELLNKHKTVL